MGYPDLQHGRPRRDAAGDEPAGGPVPAQMPGEEATGYGPLPVPGTAGTAWTGDGTAGRPAYRSDAGGPGNGGMQHSGPLPVPGTAGTAWTGDGTAGRPAYRSDAGGPGNGGMGNASPRPAPRTGAHRAAAGAVPARPASPARPEGRPGSHRLGAAEGLRQPADGGSPPPPRPVTGPQGQSWLSSPPGAAPGAGSATPGRPATGPRHSSRPASPAQAGGDRSRPASPTPAGRAWPAAPASTGPRVPYRSAPSGDADEPPGLAITREPPGARRGQAPQAGAPRSGGRRGPFRGHPPRPGQPDPVYPPGEFSSWNRASTRSAWLGAARGGPAEAEADPGYSALALSDAAADLTATQTWAVIDDEPPPSASAAPATRRDWGSHTEDTGPRWQRTGDGPATAGRGTGGRGAESRADSWTTAPRRGRRGPGAGPGDRTALGPGATGLARTATAGPGTAGPGTERPGTGGLGGSAGHGGSAGLGAGLGAAARQGPVLGAAAGGLAGTERPGTVTAGPDRDTGGLGRQAPPVFDESRRGRRPGGAAVATAAPGIASDSPAAPAGRRSGRRSGRRNASMAALLLAPVLVVVLVVAGYVYLKGRHAPAGAPRTASSSHPPTARNSPAATLGTWKHIEDRSLDPTPLTVTELFPATFSNHGETGTLTVSKSGSKCSREVFGPKLASAIRKGGCTQVLRASYLSTDHKIMATIGVLNLKDATAAEKAGKAAGATEFIKQLAAKRGPTRNIAKGTGIVEAGVKGHYLILTWTEFANLHAPSGKTQRQKLEAFSAGLVGGTANVSLTSRMVTGKPPAATTKS